MKSELRESPNNGSSSSEVPTFQLSIVYTQSSSYPNSFSFNSFNLLATTTWVPEASTQLPGNRLRLPRGEIVLSFVTCSIQNSFLTCLYFQLPCVLHVRGGSLISFVYSETSFGTWSRL